MIARSSIITISTQAERSSSQTSAFFYYSCRSRRSEISDAATAAAAAATLLAAHRAVTLPIHPVAAAVELHAAGRGNR